MTRRVLSFAGLGLIAVLGGVLLYWGLYLFTFRTPYDPVGMRITRFVPDPPRLYVCQFLNWRHGEIAPPFGCERHWKYTIPREMPPTQQMAPARKVPPLPQTLNQGT